MSLTDREPSGARPRAKKRRERRPKAAQATLAFDAKDSVGESRVYDDTRHAVVWVDIGGKRTKRLSLSDLKHAAWPAPDFPTSIALPRDGGGSLPDACGEPCWA
jgi:sugar lactone lactonase YvrE